MRREDVGTRRAAFLEWKSKIQQRGTPRPYMDLLRFK